MQCQQANELFSDYIERNLDAALTVSVDNHLTACATCRDEMASLRQLWSRLDAMPVVEPPAALHANLMAAIDTQLAAAEATQESRNSQNIRPASGGGILDFIRAMFRPQALAFAAGLTLVVISGLEVAHGVGASVPSPVSAILSLIIHPKNKGSVTTSPTTSSNTGSNTGLNTGSISVIRNTWHANPDGTGTLTVVLKATPDTSGSQSVMPRYTVELVEGNATDSYSAKDVKAKVDGSFDASGDATITLPVNENLKGINVSLVFSLPLSASDASNKQQIVVPLTLNNDQ